MSTGTDTESRAPSQSHWRCCSWPEVVAPLSLTGLRLVPDPFLTTTEVRVHPEIIARVWKAFIETDLLRSAYPREKISLIVVSSAGDDVA